MEVTARTGRLSKQIIILSVLLLFVYGCGPGGGSASSSLGSLFETGSGIISSGFSDSSSGGSGASSGEGFLSQGLGQQSVVGGGGETLARIHNPEPATMFLLGSGLMMMGYERTRRKKK